MFSFNHFFRIIKSLKYRLQPFYHLTDHVHTSSKEDYHVFKQISLTIIHVTSITFFISETFIQSFNCERHKDSKKNSFLFIRREFICLVMQIHDCPVFLIVKSTQWLKRLELKKKEGS